MLWLQADEDSGAWVVRVFSFFFSFISVRWRLQADEWVVVGRCSMVAAVAGVAVGGWLVVGWPVGGGGGGLECEEMFLFFFPLLIFLFFFFLNGGNRLS